MKERYDLRGMTVDQFKEDLNDIWRQSIESGKIKELSDQKGWNYSDIESLEADQIIDVERKGVGLTAEATEIIIIFLPVVAEIVKDLWKYVFLPMIKRKGEDVLTPRED